MCSYRFSINLYVQVMRFMLGECFDETVNASIYPSNCIGNVLLNLLV